MSWRLQLSDEQRKCGIQQHKKSSQMKPEKEIGRIHLPRLTIELPPDKQFRPFVRDIFEDFQRKKRARERLQSSTFPTMQERSIPHKLKLGTERTDKPGDLLKKVYIARDVNFEEEHREVIRDFKHKPLKRQRLEDVRDRRQKLYSQRMLTVRTSKLPEIHSSGHRTTQLNVISRHGYADEQGTLVEKYEETSDLVEILKVRELWKHRSLESKDEEQNAQSGDLQAERRPRRDDS